MYSRFSNNSEPIQIPEHYSGCAFPAKKSATVSQKSPSTFLEVGKPSPAPAATPVSRSLPPPPRDPDPPREEEKKEPPTPPHEEKESDKPPKSKSIATSSPFSSLFGNIGSAFPFSHGLGFEELLILGLIVLLSRNEDESDLVLMLGLLLFCG